VPVGVAEQLVADCYHQIAITEHTYAQLAQRVEAAFTSGSPSDPKPSTTSPAPSTG
jgi:hypothetical protein